MALITDAMLGEFWRDVYRLGRGKEQLRGLGLSPVQIKAAIQALEDRWESSKAILKSDMEAAAGVTLAPAQARALGRAWLTHKASRGNV